MNSNLISWYKAFQYVLLIGKVVLLAGGTGSRMYPLTTKQPKFLLPVANRPLISYQLELLEKAGITGYQHLLFRGNFY